MRIIRQSKATLELARFKKECCLRGLALNGRQIRPDEVVKDCQAAKATLELAHFKAECCLRGLVLNGQQVTPDAVIKDFPDSPASKLGIARFKQQCCLMGLPLHGQQVTPDEVARDYQAVKARLELARFKEQCCLGGLLLNGQPVTPDAVVKSFPDSPEGKLGLARFKEQCCLKNLLLNGRQVTPDAVVEDFPESAEGKLGIARFKQECCLRGLVLNGQQVKPDAVVKDFSDSPAGKLGVARFKAECCLRGLTLNDQQVTPEAVVKDYQAARVTLELARFKQECCLIGLPLNGQQVIPDAVVKAFPDSPEGKLGIARFKQECCLIGLLLNGRQVTPDAVVKDFPDSPEGKLGIARFKVECCLRGLTLNGRQVTPDAVVEDFPKSAEGKLGIARFKQECCLRGLALNGQQVVPGAVVEDFQAVSAILELAYFKQQCCLRGLLLNGQQVTPEAVVNDYQAARAALELACFKELCCLRGLVLNGRQVISDAVVKDYERGGWLLEKAIFYSQLVLNARALNSGYLDNQKVLAAFNDVPGDHSSRQAEYLIQRLKQPQRYDEADDAQDTIQQAWQILNSVSIKNDEQRRLQCILKFMAMQYQLLIDHQSVSAEVVWQTITTLRSSFQNSRLQFFFLAQCYITSQSVDGRQIHKSEVLKSLQRFPEGSRLRHALSRWLERCSDEANIMDELLFKRDNAVPGWDNDRRNSHAVHSVNSSVKEKAQNASAVQAATVSEAQNLTQALKQMLKIGMPFFPGQQVAQFNTLTLKALEILQEINGGYTDPPIVITGSYARFLQNRCSSFNDIDIICATEGVARTLLDRLRLLNTDRDAEIPKRILIWPMHGCQEIKLPKAYNIVLREGDFDAKAMGFQVSVDTRLMHGNVQRLSVCVPGVEQPVCCLPFAEETGLLNDTLEYLADNLVALTDQLQKGEQIPNIPRTILFNLPKTTEERIYGLLMRSLLTLNKARQFIDLYSEGNPDDQPDQLRQEQQRLYALTGKLQWTLRSHAYRDGFEQSVNRWLSTTAHVTDYEIKRKDFINVLLAMIRPDAG
ncbi:hypothetical protein [Endozoicomonas sp. SCSIO W0465]|uniref:hypothetical protein n=1 Tax=Endozoicomonas sp. SCSIO W0465 TaxID=2918516 RepID=UPI002075FCEA|nr:hypothetical protein [Endozoicomonas sp. SCSIO W0465]USE34534.1 hypothetical protein MJO57_20640 [Endozoicomonas sp. SCSIO W0465]